MIKPRLLPCLITAPSALCTILNIQVCFQSLCSISLGANVLLLLLNSSRCFEIPSSRRSGPMFLCAGYASRNQTQMDYAQAPTLQQPLHPSNEYSLPELSGDMGLEPLIAPGNGGGQDQLEWLDTDI